MEKVKYCGEKNKWKLSIIYHYIGKDMERSLQALMKVGGLDSEGRGRQQKGEEPGPCLFLGGSWGYPAVLCSPDICCRGCS